MLLSFKSINGYMLLDYLLLDTTCWTIDIRIHVDLLIQWFIVKSLRWFSQLGQRVADFLIVTWYKYCYQIKPKTKCYCFYIRTFSGWAKYKNEIFNLFFIEIFLTAISFILSIKFLPTNFFLIKCAKFQNSRPSQSYSLFSISIHHCRSMQ